MTTDDAHARWRAAEIARREAWRLASDRTLERLRRERDAKQAAARARYTDDLAAAFADHLTGDAGADAHTLAHLAVERLFLPADESGAPCDCSCHPRLPEGLHDFGFACRCRGASATTPARTLGGARATWPTLPVDEAARARAADEAQDLAAWLATQPDVVVTEHGGAAPEQWTGAIAGRRFYFRERWEHWTLDLDVHPVPSLAFRGVDPDGVGIYEDDTIDEGTEIAGGSAGCPGYGQTPRERAEFIVGLLRRHITGEDAEDTINQPTPEESQ
ncbi:hypothetical protein [Xylanimonas ulmi]|uniref:Uncharacterized protein n=1 Tax=Xylanimonas ulmi TaxID=228973 RepID=A0A4Q7M4G4_9MICO|nr:hypothetical protein [Xylanibacterium ulmi]RZS62261.1 hypothetical protein EV386_2587 [Xylanibacterium ulmi]